jgi:DNA polymerase-3 subunit epsilon
MRHSAIINPRVPIPKEASDVHGITNDMVRNAPPLNRFASSIEKLFEGATLAGYNIRKFDVPLIVNDLQRATSKDFSWIYELPILDTFILYQKYRPRTLTAAYEDLIGGEFDAHDAGADVEATRLVTEALVGKLKAKSLEELQEMSVPEGFADFAGKLVYINDVLCYNFSKYRGTPVKKELGFAYWMLGNDFPEMTKRLVEKELGI